MDESNIYSIGDAANIAGLQPSALRYYDKIGLVVPTNRGQENNYRYYTRNQVVTLCVIKRLRELGCGVEDIKTLLEKDTLEVFCQVMRRNTSSLADKIARLEETLRVSEEFSSRLEEALRLKASIDEQVQGNSPPLGEMRIEQIPRIPLFVDKQVIKSYDNSETSVKMWQHLYTGCQSSGYKIIGSGITTYITELLGQFIVRDCELHIGLKVEAEQDDPNVTIYGGFQAATALYSGQYAGIITTYLSLMRWLNHQGFEAYGYASEEFILSPIDTHNQKFQVIKIIIPVRPRP